MGGGAMYRRPGRVFYLFEMYITPTVSRTAAQHVYNRDCCCCCCWCECLCALECLCVYVWWKLTYVWHENLCPRLSVCLSPLAHRTAVASYLTPTPDRISELGFSEIFKRVLMPYRMLPIISVEIDSSGAALLGPRGPQGGGGSSTEGIYDSGNSDGVNVRDRSVGRLVSGGSMNYPSHLWADERRNTAEIKNKL